jgi:hypothetical protein
MFIPIPSVLFLLSAPCLSWSSPLSSWWSPSHCHPGDGIGLHSYDMTYPSPFHLSYHKEKRLGVALHINFFIVNGSWPQGMQDSSEKSGLEDIYFVGYGSGNLQKFCTILLK